MADSKKGGLRKDGTSRRTRAGRSGHGGLPRVMILAVVVIVAGAALLFWPRGGSVPTGIGENQTVVTASEAADTPGVPHSGEVDISSEAVTLIPEKAETPAEETPPPVEKTVTAPVEEKTTPPPPTKTQTTKPAAKPKPQPLIEPVSNGPYGVQTGSFLDAGNADKEAARLKAKGWDTRVRAASNSEGEMVYRVWIVYFKTRTDAQTFINQNPRDLKGAIPVHR